MSSSKRTQSMKSGKESVDSPFFLFKWATPVLGSYSITLRNKHLKPLVIKCDYPQYDPVKMEKMPNFDPLSDKPWTVPDDREDIKQRLLSDQYSSGNDSNQKNPTIQELAAIYRFRELLKMIDKVHISMQKTIEWIDKSKKKGDNVSDIILPSACQTMFEATLAIGEVFRLQSVDWTNEKLAQVLKPTQEEYYQKGDSRLDTTDPKYIEHLVGKINLLRCLAYVVTTAFIVFLENMFVTVSQKEVGVDIHVIKGYLSDLPPQFLFTSFNPPMTKRSAKHLKNPPTTIDERFPMFPVDRSKKKDKKKENDDSRKANISQVSSKKYGKSKKSLMATMTETHRSKSKSKSKSKTRSDRTDGSKSPIIGGVTKLVKKVKSELKSQRTQSTK